MPNKKIFDLPRAASITGNEVIPLTTEATNTAADLNFISAWFNAKPTAYNFGALADDPAVSPFDGGPIPLGAQYYNTTLNAIRAFGDSGWFTPNLDAAIFAATTGAQLVGTPTGTVQAALDARPTSVDLAAADGSAGIGYTPGGDGAVTQTLEALLRDSVTPDGFGAVGNGIADDVVAIEKAAERARLTGKPLVFPGGRTYGISRYAVIKPGLKRILGNGGVIKCLNDGTGIHKGLYFPGIAGGQASNHDGIHVQGVRIDRNGQLGNGIFGQNITRSTFVFNEIVGGLTGNGIVNRSYGAGLESPVDNLFAYNYISGDASSGVAQSTSGIDIAAEYNYTPPYVSADEQWKAIFTAPGALYPPLRNRIVGNTIVGGYYGISINGAADCVVTGNCVSSNMRNISCQNDATNNTISNNSLRESISSGVHLAYGSTGNLISGNNIFTSRASLEGLLQAYVGTKRNKFVGNRIECVTSAPKYMVYCGVHADGNEFIDNTLIGLCARAYIAVESGWDSTITNPSHRGYGLLSSVTDGFNNVGTTGVVVRGNKVSPDSNVPVIFLGQVGATSPLAATLVQGNEMTTTTAGMMSLLEQNGGLLSATRYTGNVMPTTTGVSTFVLPRGMAHFHQWEGNTNPSSASGGPAFVSGDTTPSVAGGDNWRCANAGATSITYFDDGMDGQQILVRLDANTTIVHNNSFIRAKGNANIVGASSNVFVSFIRLSNIWFELSRSF